MKQARRALLLGKGDGPVSIQLKKLYECVKNQPEFQIRLLAGENGLDNVVTWVHMVEGEEISRFLEGGEVAFTTGIALSGGEELIDLVKTIQQNGASGLVINCGPYIPAVPAEIADFCNENDFPLFSVPWHVYMAQIMKKFCEEITTADRTSMELTSAVKNAVFFPAQEELYVPILERYGFSRELPYCAAVLSVVSNDCDRKNAVNYVRMAENIGNFITPKYPGSLVFELNGAVLAVFMHYTDAMVLAAVGEMMKYGKKLLPDGDGLYCGIGRNTKSVRCLCKSYRIAQKVMRLQVRLGREDTAVAYRDLGVYRILMAVEDDEMIREYYTDTIEPLIQYDEINETGYMDFLKVHFETGGNIQKTAGRLYMHRNSVIYKIHKIEEILGCDLSDLNVRTEINLAVKLHDLL